jgi:hypothetical protein
VHAGISLYVSLYLLQVNWINQIFEQADHIKEIVSRLVSFQQNWPNVLLKKI